MKTTSPTENHPKKLAYIVEEWPGLSNTFIYNEVRLLLDEGIHIQILSLTGGPGSNVQASDEAIIARTDYHSPKNVPAFLLDHLLLFFSAPLRYLRALALTLLTFRQSPKELLKGAYVFYQAGRAARWGREKGVDQFHAHFAGRMSALACTSHWLIGIPFSFTVHAGGVYRADQQLVWRIRDARFVIAISDHIRDALLKISGGQWGDKIHLIRLGVRPDQLTTSAAHPPSDPRIIAVGRLVTEKGFHVLIDACKLLKTRGKSFRCTIIGDGPLHDELAAQVQREQLSAVVSLLGPLPHSAVMQHISEATILAMPSIVTADLRSDGIPTVLSEAMGSGVAVVSTPVGGIPELVEHDQTGLLVPQKSADALADALETLLADAPLRQRLAAAGKAHVQQHFDLIQNTQRLAQRFRSGLA